MANIPVYIMLVNSNVSILPIIGIFLLVYKCFFEGICYNLNIKYWYLSVYYGDRSKYIIKKSKKINNQIFFRKVLIILIYMHGIRFS